MLVVDDDDDVRRAMTGVLTDRLHHPDARRGPRRGALPDFKPDLVIVDFAMPGQNGAEIAHVIGQAAPDLPIVFVSGYADDLVLETLGGNAPVLRKPFLQRTCRCRALGPGRQITAETAVPGA